MPFQFYFTLSETLSTSAHSDSKNEKKGSLTHSFEEWGFRICQDVRLRVPKVKPGFHTV